MREFFYEPEGEWRTYEYLYNTYGITIGSAIDVALYNESLEVYHGWDYDSKTWVDDIGYKQWYTEDNIPLYRKSETPRPSFYIDQPLNLDTYTRRTSTMYGYNDQLNSWEYLHNRCGITDTPSNVYYMRSSVILCWYNEAENKYWDELTKKWYDTAPIYDGDIDVDDINKVGAMGMFTFYDTVGNQSAYGSIVSGSQLQPICLNFPNSGQLSYTRVSTSELTGTWRLLTAIRTSSPDNPAVVIARKVSEDELDVSSLSHDTASSTASSNTNSTSNTHNRNFTEIIEYDL